jgi:RNA polymerase sigma factor (sigma-70 family)
VADATSTSTEPSDAALISEVRSGNLDAYGDLFSRHREAATRLAGQLVRGPDADDLVAEAFVRVMAVLQAGKGPDEFFRAYLLSSIRRLHIDRIRAGKRVRTTGDEAELDRAIEFVDPAEMRFEQSTAAAAFASLPERWQMVLWHLDVEGQKPAQIAPLLGMSPNSVSALAYRAREGLRVAYLDGHLAPPLDDSCRRTTAQLAPYVRKGLSARETAAVEEHLDSCARCTALYLELAEVNSNLAGLLAPAVLGTAAAGYLASGGASAALGVTGGGATRAARGSRRLGLSAQAAVIAAAIVAVAAVGAFAASRIVGGGGDDPSAGAPLPGRSAQSTPDGGPSSRTTKSTPTPSTSGTPLVVPTPTAVPTDPLVRLPPVLPTLPTLPPTTPPTTPPTPPGPTTTDYGVGVSFVSVPEVELRREVTVPTTSTGDTPRGNLLTATLEFNAKPDPGANQVITYRGGTVPDWDCDTPADGQPVTMVTCTRTQTGASVPPIRLTVEGYYPGARAAISAAGNVDPAPGNDVATARACDWDNPGDCPAY